jgi:hypothetical protein
MGDEAMEFDWTQGALAEGLRLYHAGEFFAALGDHVKTGHT